LTTGKENRKPKSRKGKRAVPSKWRRNKTQLLRNTGLTYRTFKIAFEIPERKIAPLVGPLVD